MPTGDRGADCAGGARRAIRGALVLGLLAGLLGMSGCERGSQPAPGGGASAQPAAAKREPAAAQTLAPAEPAAAAPAAAAPAEIRLTPAMEALAQEPAGQPTGLFIDRQAPGDLRVVTYNVHFDDIFPAKNQAGAEKFQRVLKALDPDVIALQEIRDNTTEAVDELLKRIDPAPAGGRKWHVYKGGWNVIASKYPLSATRAELAPSAKPLRDPAVALVDLPDDRFERDLYVLNSHFKCCGGEENDPQRQRQADTVVAWLRDACTPGDAFDLPEQTPIVIVGDLNLVGGPQVLETLLTGDIQEEEVCGVDFAPDWDRTPMTDARPLHNGVGPDDYTWRNDNDQWDPGRLDYVLYTDSVLEVVQSFVLNTTTLTDEQLAAAGLQKFDVTLDVEGREFDHLPVVADFRLK